MHTNLRLTGRKATVSMVLITGLVFSGCSSGNKGASASGATATTSRLPATSASPAQNTSGAACDIVSDEVVRSVLRVEIVRREGKVTQQGSAKGLSCIKGSARTNDTNKFNFVSAAVYPAEVAGGGALLDQAVSKMGGTSVPGLGDRAVFAASGVLFIIKGADVVQAQVTRAGKPGTLQDCTAVAKDMLSRR